LHPADRHGRHQQKQEQAEEGQELCECWPIHGWVRRSAGTQGFWDVRQHPEAATA